ncbi:transmembrane protein 132C-like [Synchiropus splendidus]|uniref:transmembrane protein 132C-like n=1 Tax=Synchiropus splendidus TaxID=270530 RepID=UPI00237E49C4|nr:transmembrane protein 132C-like [Synchiropus splendidus]
MKLWVGLCTLLLCPVVDSRLILEGNQRYGPTPIYLPVTYKILNAETAFFLHEANQDLMRNSSLQARTESFFIHKARQMPFINASYGPLSVQQPVPLELLQPMPGPFNTPSFTASSEPTSASSPPPFTFNWKVHTYIISERIHPSWPKVQVLFYIAGRDWSDYSAIHKMPCIWMFAFHETQEVRGTCRLKGELGICVAELEPLASWFSPPTVRPGRQRLSEQTQGTPVELYYIIQTTNGGECNSEGSRKSDPMHSDQPRPIGYYAGHTPMRRIGSVRLFQPLSELKLDNDFVVMIPSKPIRQRETISAFLSLSTLSSVQIFTLRVRLMDGLAFLGAKATNPVAWSVSQDVRSEGHRVLTLHCRRKENGFSQRMEAAGYQKVLQVDLEVNGMMVTEGGRVVTWQVEYPLTRTLSTEVQTLIRLAPQDLGGIVPLAMDTEILNTAVLTGRTVAVPVKVVTVGTDGAVSDVTESVECKSTDEQVIKVSERCDYVYVNGRETRGNNKVLVNFTYSFLSAQLEMSVWIPQLPLLIDVADTELNQVKGWRVPLFTGNRRYERVTDITEDADAAERPEATCVAQYQSTSLRVLTQFIAQPEEGRGAVDEDGAGQKNILLGSDWQVEVTQLVKDFLKVEDTRFAELLNDHVVIGLKAGTTKLQVLSPLTSEVMAEKSITVVDNKVSVTELGLQLVSQLSLSIHLSQGSNSAIVATTTTQEVIRSLNQESLISAWLQFSDGSTTPLENYHPSHFALSTSTLNEQVVQVQRKSAWRWPVIVAKGQGQGSLVRVEMSQSEQCQRGKRRTIITTGTANVRVLLGQSEEQYRQPGDRLTQSESPNYGGSISDSNTGTVKGGSTPVKSYSPTKPNGGRLSADNGSKIASEFAKYPDQAELPRSRTTNEESPPRRGLTDLEIGMYALLGVFGLAILVFLINCISYAYKYRTKQLSLESPETMPHTHDWVWLGQEEGLCRQQQQEDELCGALEEGSHLLNGVIPRGCTSTESCDIRGRDHKNDSPTTKRKRVKFTTFSNSKSSNGCPGLSPLALRQTSEITWVCPDIKLGESEELREFKEKLNQNAIKNIA